MALLTFFRILDGDKAGGSFVSHTLCAQLSTRTNRKAAFATCLLCLLALDFKQISREVGQEFGTIFGNQDHVFNSHISFVREKHLRFTAEHHAWL